MSDSLSAAGGDHSSGRWLPQVLSAGCSLTPRGGGFSGHVHDYDEICLVANERSWLRHGGVERRCEAGSLFLFRRGEFHGYRNEGDDEPHLWIVHYRADEALYRDCPSLVDPDPERRVWPLDAAQQAAYQGIFVRLQAELAAGDRPGAAAAAAAWLRLLLIAAARWSAHAAPEVAPPPLDPELMTLWEVLQEHLDRPADLPAALRRRVPNYDSLRHRFRRVFGIAPRDLLVRSRMGRAKQLLIESQLSVSDIATRLGYARVQEFSRAFHAHVNQTPQAFRINPS